LTWFPQLSRVGYLALAMPNGSLDFNRYPWYRYPSTALITGAFMTSFTTTSGSGGAAALS